MRRPHLALAAAATLSGLALSAGATPGFQAIAAGALPPAPVVSASPVAIDEGAVPWLTITGLGAPLARPGAGKKKGAKAPPVFEENQLTTTTGGCLRVLSSGHEADLAESLVVNVAEALVPVQREQVIRDEQGGARLALAQAWVDLRTRSARPIAGVEVPLTRLQPTFAGLDTWGVREPGGLRVVVSIAPEAVGTRRGMLVTQPCQLAMLQVRDDPDGHQESLDFNRDYLDRPLADNNLSTVTRPLRLLASLSRLSRDRDPVVSVGLRLLDGLPAPKIDPAPAASAAPLIAA